MCGIAGIYHFNTNQEPLNERVLVKIREAMRHRGPDAAGLWISPDKKIGLAHRRLAIIDLNPRANQPMSDNKKKIWLVFNGEIYNFKAIKKELSRCPFNTNSDTEVIIYAYKKWGINCVKKFRGMFAFALWDERIKTLYLARDRIGIKPLYYTFDKNHLIFASEIQAIFQEDRLKKEISTESLYHYLSFLTTPAPDTMFKNIFKLEAGTVLKIEENGKISQTRYWDSADFLNNPLPETDENKVIEQTKEILKEAVSLRLISDVPLGTTFSGGVDSTLIAALMKEEKNNLSALTIDYEVSSPYNESEIAKEIAAELNLNLTLKRITNKEYLEGINGFLKIQPDLPVGDPNTILMYLISGLVKKSGMTVCLVGEGGDEIGGYPSYLKINKEYQSLKYFAALPALFKRALYGFSFGDLKKGLGLTLGKCVVSRRHIHAFSEEEKKRMWLLEPVNSYPLLEKIMQEVETTTKDGFLRKILNVEFKLRLPELILPRVDLPTMAESIEARVPFLDHKLVEYSLRLPFSVKMKNDEPKYILKKLMSGWVDEKYAQRKKVGFGMLLLPFLNNTLPVWFKEQVLQKNNHPLFSYLDKKELLKIQESPNKTENQGFKLWTLYALARWLEINI